MPRLVDHDQRRAAIAAATLRVLAAEGLAGATVRRVAGEMGVTTGLITHYFPARDSFVRMALDAAWSRAEQRMVVAAQQPTGAQALRAVLIEALPLDRERREEWKVWLAFWAQAAVDPAIRREHAARYRAWRTTIVEITRRALQDGSLASSEDPEHLGELLVTAVDGLGMQATLEPRRLTRTELERRLDALLDR